MSRYGIATLAICLATAPVRAQPERSSSIAGRVVNSVTGAPLHRATVEITLEGRDDVRGHAGTEGDGQFLLRALPAGRYRISVTRPGYAPMNYGARRPNAPGQIITLGVNENKSGLIVRMPALGTVSGTVSGLPTHVVNASVRVIPVRLTPDSPNWVQVRSGAVDGQGHYRIHGLLPGRYRILIYYTPGSPPQGTAPSVGYDPYARVATYYPSTLNREEARIVEVAPGADLTGLDIAARGAVTIRRAVRVQWPAGIELPKPESAAAAPPLTVSISGPTMLDPSAAQFSIPFGEVWPVYRTFLALDYVISGVIQLQGRCYATRREVDFSTGLQEVVLALEPCADISGSIRVEGAEHQVPAGLRVGLRSAESDFVGVDRAEVRPDGSFVLHGVPPGDWHVQVRPLPAGSYVKSITLGSVSALDKPIRVISSTANRLQIVMSSHGAEVRGHVENGLATLVLAAPQGETAGIGSRYATSNVDENGNFHLRGLYPGTYRIYAFEDLEPQAWLDPGLLDGYRENSTEVVLREGAGPTLELRAIPGTGTTRKQGEN